MRSALIVLAALPLLAATNPAPAKPCSRLQAERVDARQPARMRKLGPYAAGQTDPGRDPRGRRLSPADRGA